MEYGLCIKESVQVKKTPILTQRFLLDIVIGSLCKHPVRFSAEKESALHAEVMSACGAAAIGSKNRQG